MFDNVADCEITGLKQNMFSFKTDNCASGDHIVDAMSKMATSSTSSTADVGAWSVRAPVIHQPRPVSWSELEGAEKLVQSEEKNEVAPMEVGHGAHESVVSTQCSGATREWASSVSLTNILDGHGTLSDEQLRYAMVPSHQTMDISSSKDRYGPDATLTSTYLPLMSAEISAPATDSYCIDESAHLLTAQFSMQLTQELPSGTNATGCFPSPHEPDVSYITQMIDSDDLGVWLPRVLPLAGQGLESPSSPPLPPWVTAPQLGLHGGVIAQPKPIKIYELDMSVEEIVGMKDEVHTVIDDSDEESDECPADLMAIIPSEAFAKSKRQMVEEEDEKEEDECPADLAKIVPAEAFARMWSHHILVENCTHGSGKQRSSTQVALGSGSETEEDSPLPSPSSGSGLRVLTQEDVSHFTWQQQVFSPVATGFGRSVSPKKTGCVVDASKIEEHGRGREVAKDDALKSGSRFVGIYDAVDLGGPRRTKRADYRNSQRKEEKKRKSSQDSKAKGSRVDKRRNTVCEQREPKSSFLVDGGKGTVKRHTRSRRRGLSDPVPATREQPVSVGRYR